MSDRHNEHIELINGKRRRTRIDVLAISVDGMRVLVQYNQQKDIYDFPGGGLDKNDTIGQTAIREAAEEAGWVCTNPIEMNVSSCTLFKDADDRYYHEQGWDEELQVPVLCNAIQYQPRSAYNSEADAGVFELKLINEVLAGCQRELERVDTKLRRKIQLQIRIEILAKQFDSIKETKSTAYLKW